MGSVLDRRIIQAVIAALVVAVWLAAPTRAIAQTFGDVTSGCWARTAIGYVTDIGPAGRKALDDYGSSFKPEKKITRAELARALVTVTGHQDDQVKAIALPDVVPDLNEYYWDIQIALSLKLMSPMGDGFHPDDTVPAYKAEGAIVRMVKMLHPDDDWSMLTSLRSGSWTPVAGWKPNAPTYLPYVVASRALLLRYNHPYGLEEQEVSPREAIDRAEIAYMLREALTLNEWEVDSLAAYRKVTLPTLSKRQKQIAAFALKYVGYPYVFAGEYPTTNSPYGYQEHGGFDCSGFDWWVMKIHFGYPISVNERGASYLAENAPRRIARSSLKCGDLMFFGPDGPDSPVRSIYHAALYLGNGWFIHSTGSSDGVTIVSLNASQYWRSHFAWGRRLLTKAELAVQ